MKRVGFVFAVLSLALAIGFGFLQLCLKGYEQACQGYDGVNSEERNKFGISKEIYIAVVEWLDGHEGAVVGLGTLLVAIFTWRLVATTNKLWTSGEKQMKVTAESANQAKLAAQIAETAFVSNQRPWVKINHITQRGGVGLAGADDKDGSYNLNVEVKNVGNSPAVCIWANAKMVGDRFPTDAELTVVVESLRRKAPIRGITLVPTDSTTVVVSCPPDKDPVKNVDLGLVVCCVFYTFPFKSTQSEGKFVTVHRVSKNSLVGRNLKFDLSICYADAD